MAVTIDIDITARDVFAQGHSYANVGAYERLLGRVHYRIDPNHHAYASIVDIDKAPRDDTGKVRFSTDLCILKPVRDGAGNRRLFFAYGNRGNKRELQFFNDAPASNEPISAADGGNGFLMRRGYSIVWAAWEGDLLPGNGRMLFDAPIATNAGKDITGLVRSEFIVNSHGVTTLPLSGQASTRSYPAVSLDTAQATLTRRRYPGDTPQLIDSKDWCFARLEAGAGLDGQGAEQALVASDSHIHVIHQGGFSPGWIYELVYTAKQPRVYGLGHTVVRDLVSFLKYHGEDRQTGVSPLGPIDKAYAWGRSQTGRCLRDFVYYGYNEDHRGRRVFDGIMPHVSGGGLMWMNHRFAKVVSPAGQQYEDHHNVADRFPFSYAKCTDHLTGRSDAILKRPDTDPHVLHTQTATEYWQRRGSLVHTDTEGNDLEQPGNVRVYLWSSSQHFADPNLKSPSRGVCQALVNVVSTSMLFRAMLDALDDWVTHGTPPPASAVPRRDDGTLVAYDEWRNQFPSIPGVAVPSEPNALPLLDFGEGFSEGILSQEPPKVVDENGYTILVPAVDEDGNDVAGVRAPMVRAPLATYTGWALRARGYGHGAMFEFSGSTLPFADTPSEAKMIGDSRSAISERYADSKAYQAAIEAAARQLVAERLMLEEDVARCVAAAANWGAPRHDVGLA